MAEEGLRLGQWLTLSLSLQGTSESKPGDRKPLTILQCITSSEDGAEAAGCVVQRTYTWRFYLFLRGCHYGWGYDMRNLRLRAEL